MRLPAIRPVLAVLGLLVLPFVLSTGVGSMAYFHFGNPQHTCASCHEMGSVHSEWSQSAHRTLHCRNCHGGSLTLDAHALSAHFRRVVQHFSGEVVNPIRLSEDDVIRVHESCRSCHPQSFADWESGPHAATYERIFLDSEHNETEQPADDCFRCHGMFYQGAIEDLITPVSKTGPWSFKDDRQALLPAIPCLACHQIHSAAGGSAGTAAHFFDTREDLYFPVTDLPPLEMVQAGRDVAMSTDPRQRLCVQCHAPSAFHAHRLGSSDDRTTVGVHEGLSCLDCHHAHHGSARSSCASCHPRNSHCTAAVEALDTTYRDPTSSHNIHTVACGDCHDGKRPEPNKSVPP